MAAHDWDALATEVERVSVDVLASGVLPSEPRSDIGSGEFVPVAFLKVDGHGAVANLVRYEHEVEFELSVFRMINGEFESIGGCGTTWHSTALRVLTSDELAADVAVLGICEIADVEIAYGIAAAGVVAVRFSDDAARWPVMRYGSWLAPADPQVTVPTAIRT